MEEVVTLRLNDQQSRDNSASPRVGAALSRPVAVLVAGTPGPGRKSLATLIQAILGRRGCAVRIGVPPAASERGNRALPLNVPRIADDEAFARARGWDVVLETPLSDPDSFRAVAAAYREAGYRIEIAALATSEALSRLNALTDYLDNLSKESRCVSWADHNTHGRGLLEALAVLEAEQLVDRVSILRGDHTVLYDNELVNGTWRRRAAAERVMAYERARPWGAEETASFQRDLVGAERRLHVAPLKEEQRLVVGRYGEQAAALAEPVRRIAQATERLPGVNYHRLSAAEHQWIFDELIAPSYLSGIVSRERPRVVYLMGQPGAGKSTASKMVLRAMRPGATHLAGDERQHGRFGPCEGLPSVRHNPSHGLSTADSCDVVADGEVSVDDVEPNELAAAGYFSLSSAELDRRVRPVSLPLPLQNPKRLPLTELDPEAFEWLITEIVSRQDNRGVQFYGRSGQEQHGLDIVAREPDGRRSLYQVKRYQELTVPRIKSAIKDYAIAPRPPGALHEVGSPDVSVTFRHVMVGMDLGQNAVQARCR